MKRILGEIHEVDLTFDNCKLVYITKESYNYHKGIINNPSFWFEYKGDLYYAISDYKFTLFENYDDWSSEDENGKELIFNMFEPGKFEFDRLMNVGNGNVKLTFYKIDFKKIDDFIDHFSEYELDFCKRYRRNVNIKSILE